MPIRLVAGLGNPGKEYEGTRHNLGFDVIDALAERAGVRWERERSFEALVARWPRPGREAVYLLKPQTYVNLSGQSVGAFCRYRGIASAEVAVVYDELTLPVGGLKVSIGGSAGGHNGVASLLERFEDGFVRYRLGIGPRHPPEIGLADFVLGKLPPEDKTLISSKLPAWVDGLELLIDRGAEVAMNRLNRKSKSNEPSQE
jgi:peptidyl-tRNA hydrolase, PTH1 family